MVVSKKTPAKKAESTEFAVIKTGGKQYRVAVGDVVTVEKILGDHKEGDAVVFDKVLLVDDGKNTTIGTLYGKTKTEPVFINTQDVDILFDEKYGNIKSLFVDYT